MDQQEREELQCRKLLLDFYSSELGAHSRLIIGFAIILLTLMEIKFNLDAGARDLVQPISLIQFWLVYIGISLAALVFWFLLMRHLAYGNLVTAVITAEPSGEGSLLIRIMQGADEIALKWHLLFLVPSGWFHSTGRSGNRRDRRIGGLLCVGLALVTTFFVWLLMG